MDGRDRLERENAALRERISTLGAAVLRIGSSLDLDTVLREAVDGARALTGARYGMIATVDGTGALEDFIAPGLTDEERRHMAGWPPGQAFFEHLCALPAPLRVADLPAYLRALGYSEELTLSKTLQATPMRHLGQHVGHFFLGEKEKGEAFDEEDEEVLVLFAAQAAAAIANARVHRDERRARADLEALVDTSPVGVVVFDAASGRPQSFNREALRLVDRLRMPGRPPEQLLEVLTFRRSDGREVALDAFPLAEALRGGETVRAEEIEISVPDGRSVTALVNATPIPGEDGAVATMVVTLQDLAPLEELDRQRAEFLGLVSHELRTPLAAIKGSAASVLGAGPDLDPAEMREFFRVVDEQADHMRGLVGDLLDVGRIDAGTLSVSPEACGVAALVDRARNAFLAGGARHDVAIDLPGDLPPGGGGPPGGARGGGAPPAPPPPPAPPTPAPAPPVAADRRRIVQVLNNLLANAARHAPETTPIRVSAAQDGVHVALTVADEGRGVAPERLGQLFRKRAGPAGGGGGALGAAGLGLAICKGLVEAHGGRIRAESGGPGQGTQVTFTLPAAGDSAAAGPAPARRRASPEDPEPAPVLAVDDDPTTLRFVRDALAGTEYVPVVTGDPDAVAGLVRAEKPRLVLLDLMLPGTDGIELMERVPELGDLPVIFISAYGRDETIARALEAGAADYIVKPFSPTELVARIRAALRREAAPQPYLLGDLEIHYEERRVSVAGRDVALTATEYELLRVLSRGAGRVSTTDDLLRRVWGGRHPGDTELVRTYVKKLRRKLGDDAAKPAYIVNERGVGYRMARPGDAS